MSLITSIISGVAAFAFVAAPLSLISPDASAKTNLQIKNEKKEPRPKPSR